MGADEWRVGPAAGWLLTGCCCGADGRIAPARVPRTHRGRRHVHPGHVRGTLRSQRPAPAESGGKRGFVWLLSGCYEAQARGSSPWRYSKNRV